MYWMCKVFCRLFQAMIFKLLLIQKGVSTCIANVDTPYVFSGNGSAISAARQPYPFYPFYQTSLIHPLMAYLIYPYHQ